MEKYELESVEVTQTKGLMEQINKCVDRFRELKKIMDDAAEAYKKAEFEYVKFARGEMPDLFRMNGMEALKLDDGSMVRINTVTKLSVNKNQADKDNVARWLMEHGGESLVKSECIVPPSQIDKMKQAGIIYKEEESFNSNSLKAFLLDQLGQKGNPAQITLDDIPQGCNFYQYDEVEITKT